MILSNYRYNAINGVDADRELESGEIVPYTLSVTEIDELSDVIVHGSVESSSSELLELQQVSTFKSSRQTLIDNAEVTANGFMFDADEVSIGRMANVILAVLAEPDSLPIQWSLADTGTGIMSDITLGDLRLAQRLAVQNMTAVWSI
jgi:hypothetical protein